MWQFVFDLALEALSKHTPRHKYSKVVDNIHQILQEKLKQETDIPKQEFLMVELLKYCVSQSKADFVIQWFFGNNPFVEKIRPTIEQHWRIAEMICIYKSHYDQNASKLAIKICDEVDTTDTKIGFKRRLEALGAGPEERKRLLEKYLKGGHNWSNAELRDSIKGFNHRLITFEVRRESYKYFFDNILEAMRTYSPTNATTVFYCLFPRKDKERYCYNRLKQILKKVGDDESHILKLVKTKIEDLENALMSDYGADLGLDADGLFMLTEVDYPYEVTLEEGDGDDGDDEWHPGQDLN